ncbi:hypothetical protein K439DRAFT_478467 [Ramaria rubella]|nr:hypothetical protein K439DRAFT_478467 [Ramaria rubella]
MPLAGWKLTSLARRLYVPCRYMFFGTSTGRRLVSWLQSQRCYHDKVPTYHPKVTAIPFALSPEQAIRRTAPFIACNMIFDEATRAFASAFLPGLVEPPRPLKIEPVFIPAWFVDTEVAAKFTVHEGESTVPVCL